MTGRAETGLGTVQARGAEQKRGPGWSRCGAAERGGTEEKTAGWDSGGMCRSCSAVV